MEADTKINWRNMSRAKMELSWSTVATYSWTVAQSIQCGLFPSVYKGMDKE